MPDARHCCVTGYHAHLGGSSFKAQKDLSGVIAEPCESKDPSGTDTRAKTTNYGYWPTKGPFPSRILEPSCMVCAWFVHSLNHSLFGDSFADTDSHADRSKTDTGRIGEMVRIGAVLNYS